jgi:dTDP-glucose 4,6-dehydratase
LRNEPLPIYGKGTNVRDWLHVLDNCRAIDLVLEKGKPGDIINIGSGNEVTNIEIAKLILKSLKRPESLIKFVQDRPGHDFRYSLNWDMIRKMGWKPQMKLEEGIRNTVDWYVANEIWWAGLG